MVYIVFSLLEQSWGKEARKSQELTKKYVMMGPVMVSHNIIWTYLIAVGIDPANIDRQSTAMLFTLWKEFLLNRSTPNTRKGKQVSKQEGKDPGFDFARPVKQGLMGWPGYIGSSGPT
jgi:hypothetical protein